MTIKQRKANRKLLAAKRKWCKDNGICLQCRNKKALANLTYCQECKDAKGRQYLKKKETALAEGICYSCGAPSKRLQCDACLKGHRAINKNKRSAAKVAGMCMLCQKAPAVSGLVLCQQCRTDNKTKREQLKLSGRCPRCSGPASAGAVECDSCHEKQKQSRLKLKLEVITHYGGKCECCQTKHLEFLNVDHPDENGAAQRLELFGDKSRGGNPFYTWLKKAEYPVGYRVLCFNCNFSLFHFGYCPHSR